MGKRKDLEGGKSAGNGRGPEDEDDSGSDMDMLDVDFEWFDPQPAVDFHGLKSLCRQLLDIDNQLFELSELSDLILSQPLLGSTVKCDGNESDPFAFLTVINLHEHREKPVIKALTQYLQSKASSTLSIATVLSPDSTAQIGLILTERLMNMPAEVVPPMYTMLMEEIQWAIDEGEPYKFTHYLILSKTYAEVESKLDSEETRPSKKKRKDGAGAAGGSGETFYFHPEDEVLQRHASGTCSFAYSSVSDEGASDSKRTFQDLGIVARGHMILIEASKFQGAVSAITEYLKPPS